MWRNIGWCCTVAVEIEVKVQFPLDYKVNVVTLAVCQGICVHLKEWFDILGIDTTLISACE